MAKSTEHDFTCDGCGKIEAGAYLVGGWWSCPPGWFVADNDETSLCVCSEECAPLFDERLREVT